MNQNTRKCHINPNFRNLEMPRAHVNPLFAQNFNSQSYMHYNMSYIQEMPIAQPKIHINPRMMNIFPNLCNNTGSSSVSSNVSTIPAVINKYSKVNAKPLNPILNSNPPEVVSKPLIAKRPNYSIVRKLNSNRAQPELKQCLVKPKFISSHHKLKFNKTNTSHKFNPSSSLIKLNASLSSSSVDSVIVGGEKYIKKGNTLVRLVARSSNKSSKLVNQISLNGKTFVRKSDNIFVANQSSKKLKKVNLPCPIYRRIGVCKKHDKGKCHFVHDRKHVAICRKYLQGACQLTGCLLSHDATLEKMPTCKFYLEGCCARSDCPYLHVKVDKDADVCLNFLQGFCEAGKECLNMHVNVCPEFYKKGKCNKSVCPYPHKSIDKNIPLPKEDIVKYEGRKEFTVCNDKALHVEDSARRYYSGNKSNGVSVSNVDNCVNESGVQSLIKSVRNRVAIGDLPSFIAL